MKRPASILLGAFAAAALPLLVACPPSPPSAVYVRTAPPPPVSEVLGVAPGPDFVWVRGFYRWDGERYNWVAGHYERQPRARARWVAGHWRHNRHGWFWVEGHWR